MHAAAVASKGYRAPKLGGAYAMTADSSSPQSVAQLEGTVTVKSGAEKAPLYALSADSSHQTPAQLASEVVAESRMREQAQHAQHGLAQHELAQHGLAQHAQAHQSAQDMLSSRWANAPWASALTAYMSQPDSQHADSEHTASKAVADSSHTPLPPGRGNPQNSKPADRPAVATRSPNALFRSAPQIIRAVPRQVSSRAASQLSRPALVQFGELGKNEHDKASFGSAAWQQPTAGSASLSAHLLPDSRVATGKAAATSPLFPTGKAAMTALLLPTGKAAATSPVLPTRKAAATAPLVPTRKVAVPFFMKPCSKPWGVNKGGRAGGLSKTLGVPRGAKVSKSTGVHQGEVAKTGEQACNRLSQLVPPVICASEYCIACDDAACDRGLGWVSSQVLNPNKFGIAPT